MLYGNVNNYPKPIKVYGYTDRSNIRYISGQRKMLGIVADAPWGEDAAGPTAPATPAAENGGLMDKAKSMAENITSQPIAMAGAGAVLGAVVGRLFGKTKKQKNTMMLVTGGLGGVGGYVYSTQFANK